MSPGTLCEQTDTNYRKFSDSYKPEQFIPCMDKPHRLHGACTEQDTRLAEQWKHAIMLLFCKITKKTKHF